MLQSMGRAAILPQTCDTARNSAPCFDLPIGRIAPATQCLHRDLERAHQRAPPAIAAISSSSFALGSTWCRSMKSAWLRPAAPHDDPCESTRLRRDTGSRDSCRSRRRVRSTGSSCRNSRDARGGSGPGGLATYVPGAAPRDAGRVPASELRSLKTEYSSLRKGVQFA